MNCPECQEALHQILDGEAVRDFDALDQHLFRCASCRELHAAAQSLDSTLRSRPPMHPPPGLADRIVGQVLYRQHRRGILKRRAVRLAVAATVLLCVFTAWSLLFTRPESSPDDHSPPTPPLVENSVPPPAPLSLNHSAEEAGAALVSLPRHTTDGAIGDTLSMFSDMVPAAGGPAPEVLEQTLEPPARSLREAGQGVSAGLEPVTSSARRAVTLFLKDIPPMGGFQ